MSRILSISANDAVVHLRDGAVWLSSWQPVYRPAALHPLPVVSRSMLKEESKLLLADIDYLVIQGTNLLVSQELLVYCAKRYVGILHLDFHHKPVGFTCGEARVTDRELLEAQVGISKPKKAAMWLAILQEKAWAQAFVLHLLKVPDVLIFKANAAGKASTPEGTLAAIYWRSYFPALGPQVGRDQEGVDPYNRCLNYGYGVLSGVVHRELLLHGLNPLLGVGHVPRSQSHALVYDVLEPFRGWADAALVLFARSNQDVTVHAFKRYFLAQFMEDRISLGEEKRTRYDWVRQFVRSLCGVYKGDRNLLRVPIV